MQQVSGIHRQRSLARSPRRHPGGRHRAGFLVAAVASALLAAACASAEPSPIASPSTPAGGAQTTAIEPASPSPLSTTAVSHSGTPTPTPVAGWQLLPIQPDLGRAGLVDLVTFRDALFAIGNAATDLAPGVIWTSPDGLTWSSASGGLSLDGIYLEAIAAGDPGLVAVGQRNDRAVALFSPDGSTWSSAKLPDAAATDAQAVAWGPGGYVVVGAPTAQDLPSAVNVAWWSPDGRTWSRITNVEGSRHAGFAAVAAGRGGLLAVGIDNSRTAAWTSSDGRAWHRLSISGKLPMIARARLRFADGRYLLPSGDSVWASTDGRAWTRTRVPNEGNDVFDVAAGPGGGLIAIGRSSEGDEPGTVATADPELHAWTGLPRDPAFTGALGIAIAMSPGGNRLVAVGNSENGGSVLVADAAIVLQR